MTIHEFNSRKFEGEKIQNHSYITFLVKCHPNLQQK